MKIHGFKRIHKLLRSLRGTGFKAPAMWSYKNKKEQLVNAEG
jgi:hypothetical protein